MLKSLNTRVVWMVILAMCVVLIAIRTWRIGWFQGMDVLLWVFAGMALVMLGFRRQPAEKDRTDSGAV